MVILADVQGLKVDRSYVLMVNAASIKGLIRESRIAIVAVILLATSDSETVHEMGVGDGLVIPTTVIGLI